MGIVLSLELSIMDFRNSCDPEDKTMDVVTWPPTVAESAPPPSSLYHHYKHSYLAPPKNFKTPPL